MDDGFITIRIWREDLANLDKLIAHALRNSPPNSKMTRAALIQEALQAYAEKTGFPLERGENPKRDKS